MATKYAIIKINPRERFDQLEIFNYLHHADPDEFPKSVMSDSNSVVFREDAKVWVKEWQMDLADTENINDIKSKYKDTRGMVLTRTKWALRLNDKKGALVKAGLDESTITRLVNELVDFVYDKYDADNNIHIKGSNARKPKTNYIDDDGALVFDYD